VEQVEDPKIETPLDAVIRITTANICGSDLHPYEGRADLDAGMVLGHENMGIVEEVGAGVDRIKVGDRVSVPFNLACGTCRNCNDGWTSACLRANPSGNPGAGYGYPMMGPYWGGQAELLRVRGPTSTCWNCRPAPSTRSTSRCCPTSSRPVTTAPNSLR
jgi:glutathione-independent formaldehyde dehydrogenase